VILAFEKLRLENLAGAEFRQFLAAERKRWAPLIQKLRIKGT
jgi:tripartite-type tricarboxylate transporter receptor subunit TctC